MYGKFYKISNTSLSVSNKMLVIRAGIHKMLIRIANSEDLDQTASELIWCLSAFLAGNLWWRF